jgi:hypothetical protein
MYDLLFVLSIPVACVVAMWLYDRYIGLSDSE